MLRLKVDCIEFAIEYDRSCVQRDEVYWVVFDKCAAKEVYCDNSLYISSDYRYVWVIDNYYVLTRPIKDRVVIEVEYSYFTCWCEGDVLHECVIEDNFGRYYPSANHHRVRILGCINVREVFYRSAINNQFVISLQSCKYSKGLSRRIVDWSFDCDVIYEYITHRNLWQYTKCALIYWTVCSYLNVESGTIEYKVLIDIIYWALYIAKEPKLKAAFWCVILCWDRNLYCAQTNIDLWCNNSNWIINCANKSRLIISWNS